METGIRQAKSELSKLIRAALAGEQVVITHRGTPLVEIVPARPKPQRKDRGYGMFKGQFSVDPDEWKRADEEIERLFTGGKHR
jgi:prevent-host-death family protein